MRFNPFGEGLKVTTGTVLSFLTINMYSGQSTAIAVVFRKYMHVKLESTLVVVPDAKLICCLLVMPFLPVVGHNLLFLVWSERFNHPVQPRYLPTTGGNV